MKYFLLVALSVCLSSVGLADQTVDVKVTSKGFEPSRIDVKANEKVKLNITRTVKVTCAKKVVIPSLEIEKDLPLNKVVSIEISPAEKGEITFGCAMKQMLGAVIVVN